MSLPYRFKAGGGGQSPTMAPMSTSGHSHRSTTKQSHKLFKPRFASKGALKDLAKGKVESRREDRGKRRTPRQQVMSKIARRNQAKQLRRHHHERRDNDQSIFQGQGGAPKHVAVVPLSPEANTGEAIKLLNQSVDVPEQATSHSATVVRVDRFRRNLLYLPARYELITALDTCRLADWVLFVLSPEQQIGEEEDRFIRALEGQGITNVLFLVQGLNNAIPVPKRPKIITQLKSEMSRYFPTIDKLCVLDNQADCASIVRSLCTATSRGIRWRDERSWLLIEHLQWKMYPAGQESSAVTLTGTVRGKALNPDRLVHLPGWGDFQIGQITELPKRDTQHGQDTMEGVVKRHAPSFDQDDLLTLAPEGMDFEETARTFATDTHRGVLLDDHHYFSDEVSHIPPPPKRLPAGTSSYQAAWFLDDVSDSGSDIMDDKEQDADVVMECESERLSSEELSKLYAMDATTEAGPSEYLDSEMHVDRPADEEAQAIEDFRRSRKEEAEDDLDFPDEIEMHPNVLARERLAKYRGLKNLRTSRWNVESDAPYQPSGYRRLLKIANYKNSRKSAVRETLSGGVAAGTKVEVEILNVPISLQQSSQPNSLFSLLRHEHKCTVVNLNMTLSSAVAEPIRSKEDLIVQIGPRRFAINPIFSAAGATPNDVHKFDRFLHPGQTAVATFIGPLTWGSVPVLIFKATSAHPELSEKDTPALVDARATTGIRSTGKTSAQLRLMGNATSIPPSPSRIVAKRVILMGHPYKIHKKLVTVRYMFFNKEDVAWFSALPLWTKRGRQGYMKESLGTHGYFKATFDGKINPMDAIAVSLYKRVWPRSASMWDGGQGFAA